MLSPRPTPLNRRPNVRNLPDPHRARPPAQRVRSSASSGRRLSRPGVHWTPRSWNYADVRCLAPSCRTGAARKGS